MNTVYRASLLILPSVLALGQQFEVAAIKPSAQGAQDQTSAGLHIDGAMVRYSALSLKLYLEMAYNLKFYQISAPDWMASERWDIDAKLPDGSSPKQVPQMLQVLLRERFQMKMHRETKELPVYVLLIGKRELKLKESPNPAAPAEQQRQDVAAGAGGHGVGTNISIDNGSSLSIGNDKIEGIKLPIASLADALSRFGDRPVVNMTNLNGNYDFTMEFSPEDFRAMMVRARIAQGAVVSPEAQHLADAAPGDTLFNAVEKLGLRLEARKAPIEMLVIDQALKMPTEN